MTTLTNKLRTIELRSTPQLDWALFALLCGIVLFGLMPAKSQPTLPSVATSSAVSCADPQGADDLDRCGLLAR